MVFVDKIVFGVWGMEFYDEDNDGWESLFRFLFYGIFEILFGCLWSVDIVNLFVVGRCVDVDKWVGSVVRVMGIVIVIGYVVGIVVLMFVQSGYVDVMIVYKVLVDYGVFLDVVLFLVVFFISEVL